MQVPFARTRAKRSDHVVLSGCRMLRGADRRIRSADASVILLRRGAPIIPFWHLGAAPAMKAATTQVACRSRTLVRAGSGRRPARLRRRGERLAVAAAGNYGAKVGSMCHHAKAKFRRQRTGQSGAKRCRHRPRGTRVEQQACPGRIYSILPGQLEARVLGLSAKDEKIYAT
jgi:hypothetical protein